MTEPFRFSRAAVYCVCSLLIAIAYGIAPSSPGFAFQESIKTAVEQVEDYGRIDWTSMRAVAVGYGAAGDEATTPEEAELMGRRTAELVARRNLLETINAVHIDSETVVKDYIYQSDLIINRVKGILQNAEVDDVERLEPGSYRVTVSIPLTGAVSRLVLDAAGAQTLTPHPPDASAADTRASTQPADSEQSEYTREMLLTLENRVNSLEAEVDTLKQENKASAERFETYLRVSDAVESEKESDGSGGSLKKEVEALKKIVAELRAEQTRMTDELLRQQKVNAPKQPTPAAVPSPSSTAKPAPPSIPQPEAPAALTPAPAGDMEPAASYTGLVVDASGVNFRPTLRPRLYLQDSLIYPGPGVHSETAANHGYVRYYRNSSQALNNSRLGERPMLVRATGLHADSSDALTLDPKDAARLRALAGAPNSFLQECRVVVVF